MIRTAGGVAWSSLTSSGFRLRAIEVEVPISVGRFVVPVSEFANALMRSNVDVPVLGVVVVFVIVRVEGDKRSKIDGVVELALQEVPAQPFWQVW